MAARVLISFIAGSLLLFSARGAEGADSGRERDAARAYYRLGHEYHREKKFEKALEQLRKAAKYAPHDPDIIYATGVVLFSMGRYNEAGNHFARVLGNETGDEDTRKGAREGLLFVAQWKKAQRKRVLDSFSLYALLALAAAGIIFLIRLSTRFFRLKRPKRW